MKNQQTYQLNPRDLLETVFRYRREVIYISLGAAALGILALLFYPRTYSSEAQLFLRVGRETVGIDPTADTGPMITLQAADRKDEISSAIDVIKSRGVISQAVDRVGADVVLGRGGEGNWWSGLVGKVVALPFRAVVALVQSIDPISDRERAIVTVEHGLDVSAERGSTLINIEYDAKTPQLAQKVCNAIVEVYREEHMRIHRSAESWPFFEEQEGQLRQQLNNALEALHSAKDEMGLTDVLQRRATLESQYSAVELNRIQTLQQLATSKARVADLSRQVSKLPERSEASRKSVPNAGADLLRQQFYDLQVKAMDLRSRYNATHPRVLAINEQLAEAKEVIDAQADERMEAIDDVNPIYRQLSLELKQEQSTVAGLEARLGELDEQRSSIQNDQRTLNKHEVAIDQLSREADLARDRFFQYAKSLEEARIDKELENERISNVGVVLEPTVNERPVTPSKLLVLISTILLAIFGSASFVFGSERLGDRIRTGGDVARELDLAVLASIPNGRANGEELPIRTNGKARPETVHDSTH
jgi:uncharacterized protein involved in exopolysaccharide biosynthesis